MEGRRTKARLSVAGELTKSARRTADRREEMATFRRIDFVSDFCSSLSFGYSHAELTPKIVMSPKDIFSFTGR